MIKAAFLTQHANHPWRRQLPNGQSLFNGVDFFVPVSEADIVFVYDALPEKKVIIKKTVPTVFVVSEPENVKRYNPDFLTQFDAIVTSDRKTQHPNRIFVQAGLPWHIGSMSKSGQFLDKPMVFEDFAEYTPRKTKLVSVVSSNKDFTEEHRERLAFVTKLKEALGEQIDVFGRGINDFSDKKDVLDAYRYHISLENCAIEDYWTEKLSDPYLSLTFPIYHGCPNVTDYFPKNSLKAINIYQPDEAIEIIKEVIASDLAEKNKNHLLEARRRVMHEHNLFGLLAKIANELADVNKNVVKSGNKHFYQERKFMDSNTRLLLWLKSFMIRIPLLLKTYRFMKHKIAHTKRTLKHYWKYWTDEFYRSHHKWITENPEEELRFRYDLPSGANVLDIGGYAGDFTARFIELCNANVTVFEPILPFAEKIKARFGDDKKVCIHEAGLSDKDEVVSFNLSADGTGLFATSDEKEIQVNLWDIERFLKDCKTKNWHLAKLNVEGGEYAILNRLVETGRIKDIEYIQVQFHLNVPNARKEYKKLAKKMKKTHHLQWRYPFVWESWEWRSDMKE